MAGSGWRLTRGRGSSAQWTLIVCAVVAIFIVLLGKAESSIFDSVRAKFSDWTVPVLDSLRKPINAFERWETGMATLFSVYEENQRLREENAELRKWQNAALSLKQRVERYELLLGAVPDPEIPSITARVIGQSNRPFLKTLILNAGKGENVKPGQAVLDDRGLIGRIYLAGTRSSWVILLTDLNSRVPVTIQPSNRRAILTGDASSAPGLVLDSGVGGVMPGAIKAGDRVMSSGDGGLLPPDLPIGIVIDDGGGDYRVSLFADPDISDFVHVLDYQAQAANTSPEANLKDIPTVAPSLLSPPRASAPPAPAAPAAAAKPRAAASLAPNLGIAPARAPEGAAATPDEGEELDQ